MFEQELEMEKKSSVVPLLLIIALIMTFVGVAVYYLLDSRKVLTTQQATEMVAASLKAQGPATLHFHTGMVAASVDDKPHDPHYRLLEKAGLVKVGKDIERKTPIMLTPAGERMLATVTGVQKGKEKDGTDSYLVPLAERRLVDGPKVTMISPSRASVEYTWKWETNRMGELFEASGAEVKSFNTWDRATLIQKYGANFYHAAPTSNAFLVMKTDKGWQFAIE